MRPLAVYFALSVLALIPAVKAFATEAALIIQQDTPEATQVRHILSQIILPEGFNITLLALVPGARQMALSPDGQALFVGTRNDKVYRVELTPFDEHAERVEEFASDLTFHEPNGVCFAKDGALFIVDVNRVQSFDALQAAKNAGVKPQTIIEQGKLAPGIDATMAHSAHVCKIGPDDKLYIAIGQPYNVPPMDKLIDFAKHGIGGIVRMDQDGKNFTVFARGIRNSVGLDFNPKDKTLWFTDNQVDLMGDDIPPGELNRADRPGLNFGFPWYGGGHVRTHEYANETPPRDVVFPQVEMIAHAADLGMSFYAGTEFPPKYQGGIFSAQHGSWNRTIPVGARIMFTSLKPDGTAEKTGVFASGWLNADGSYSGHPVDVAVLHSGALLVSDDYNGAIYKITYSRP
jgi:glucose/arabinose dehydrogenase